MEEISKEELFRQLDEAERILEPYINLKIKQMEQEDGVVARSFARQRFTSDTWYEYIKNGKRDTGFMFITVNPESSNTIEDLKEAVQDFVNYGDNYIAAVAYSYEVTSNDNRCPHVHMLLRTHPQTKKEYFLKYINNKFKHLVGNVRHIDKKDIIPEDVQSVYDYLTKTQYTPAKQSILDQFRLEYNLEKVYVKGSLTC